jgi:transcriptional regulator GlxA family with amidase domain
MRGSLRSVYLEAKITELALVRLCEEVRRWDRDKQRLPVKLTEKDLCRVRDAAELLRTRLQCPPSLHELGTLVGLNVNKLKYGFRFVYGTSVFGYLHSLRLRQAFALLRDTELNVTEVAERIGYSRQSSFSVAFRREFGFPPQKAKA